MHMKQSADRLFGDDYHWSCLAAGTAQIPTIAMAAIMGGHVRVGLEDSLWYGKGLLVLRAYTIDERELARTRKLYSLMENKT